MALCDPMTNIATSVLLSALVVHSIITNSHKDTMLLILSCWRDCPCFVIISAFACISLLSQFEAWLS